MRRKSLLKQIKKRKKSFRVSRSPISRSWHLAPRIKKYQKHKERRK